MDDTDYLATEGLTDDERTFLGGLNAVARDFVGRHSEETPGQCPGCSELDWIRDGFATRRRGEPVQVFRCRGCGKKRVGHSDSPFRHPLFPAEAMAVAVLASHRGWSMQKISAAIVVRDGKGKLRSPNRQTVGRWVKRLGPLLERDESVVSEPIETSVSEAEPSPAAPPPQPAPREPEPPPASPPDEASRLEPVVVGGLVASRFEVLEQLSGATTGGVFVVRDTWQDPATASSDRVALKLLEGDAEVEREFELRTRLRHPNVAGVLDFGVLSDGRHWFTQELVVGADLFGAARGATFERVLEWMVGVLRGCAYLHGRGILHRDLKPENILVGADGRCRIVDFGISIVHSDAAKHGPSGSIAYLAPEVLAGGASEPTVDLYAVGVTFYHVVARRLPPAERPLGASGGLRAPSWFAQLLDRMLSPEPTRRLQTALMVIDAIAGHSGIRFSRETPSTIAARIEGGALVGRHAELGAMDEAVDGEDGVKGVLVRGAVGIGKTRLLEAWRQRRQLRGAEVVRADTGTLIRAMVARLGAGHGLVRRHADVVGRLTGRATDHPMASGPREGVLHDRDVVLQLVAAGYPSGMVLLVDDVDALDEPSFAVLDALVGAVSPAVRIVAAARTGIDARATDERSAALERWVAGGRLRCVHLGPLSAEAVRGMIEEAFDQSPIATDLAPRIARATEGNPRFVEEVLRGLTEQRVVHRDDAGAWRTDAHKSLPVPRQLVDACRARVLALGQPERDLLCRLATAPLPVPRDAVARLYPAEVSDELGRRALMRADGDGLSVAHDAVRQAALAGVAPVDLRRHRIAVALAVEEAVPSESRPVELLGQLLADAGEDARALPYLAGAAERATERWDVARALSWLQRIDRILGSRTVSAGEVPAGLEEQTLRGLVKMLRYMGRHDEESVCLDRLTLIAQMRGDTALLHESAALKAVYWFDRGRVELAQQICRGHLVPARDSGDRLSVARYLWVLAMVERVEGRPKEGIALSDEVLELLGEAIDPERLELRVQNYVNRGNAYGQLGRLDRAVSAFERGLTLCRQHGLSSKAILCTMNLGICHAMQCRYGPALKHFDRARQDAHRLGLREMNEVLQANQAEVERHLGLWAVAAERVGTLLDTIDERNAAHVARSARCTRAYCSVVLGDLPGAAAEMELAVRGLSDVDPMTGRVWLTEAEVRLAEGTNEARQRAARALERVSQGRVAPGEAALASAMLARLALEDGEVARAWELTGQSVSSYESGPREVREGLIEVLYTHARVLLARGEPEEAGAVLERAVAELGRVCVELEGGVREAFLAVPLHRELTEDARRVLGRSPGFSLGGSQAVTGGSAHVMELMDVLGMARRLTRATGLSSVVEIVLEGALRHSRLERGWLLSREEERFVALGGRRAGHAPLEPGACRPDPALMDTMVRCRRPITEHEARGSSSVRRGSGLETGPELKRLAVPLCYGDGLVGALYLESDTLVEGLSDHRVALLEALGDQAAMAIQHHLQVDEIERLRRRAEADLTRTRARLAEEASRRDRAERAAAAERRAAKLRFRYDQIIYTSAAMSDVLAQVDRVVDRKITVMIAGESGTGKELIARALHYNGPRAEGPFVPINCGAIPSNLIESELFGHVRGAFTGAHKDRPGHFEMAHRGTLFLDEIGEISPDVQVRLLRVLETGEVAPVGGSRRIKVDVRIAGATNRDLKTEVAEGRFREDLYYRLNTITIRLPPLRERLDDLPLLVEHFARAIAQDRGEPLVRFGPEILSRLMTHSWPGNIRELRNVVEYATLFAESGEVPVGLALPF